MIEGSSGVFCRFVRQIGILRNAGKRVGVAGIVEKRVSVSVWSGCPNANFPIIFFGGVDRASQGFAKLFDGLTTLCTKNQSGMKQ